MSDAVVAGLFALGGVTVAAVLEFIRETFTSKRERKRYAREQRTQAFLDWLTAISQMANAIVDMHQATLVASTKGQVLSDDEARTLRQKVSQLRSDRLRPALNQIRLFASSEVIESTRRAGRCLHDADQAFEKSAKQPGQLDLCVYRDAYQQCLKLMRQDLGAPAANDNLDPGGGADPSVVRSTKTEVPPSRPSG